MGYAIGIIKSMFLHEIFVNIGTVISRQPLVLFCFYPSVFPPSQTKFAPFT